MIYKQIVKDTLLKAKPFKYVWINLALWRRKLYLKYNPKVIANRSYKEVFKKDVDWDNPTNLIEKIQWLQLYSDTSLWTMCADKYRVREYVIEKGCGDTLNQLYGQWYNANEIDWSTLPNSFVLKANHSCGDVLLVKDKNKLDISSTIAELNKWMKYVYGYSSAQIHYTKIKRCVIAEKLLFNKKNPNKPLIDYKIWCFHGVPECVLVAYDRSDGGYSLSMYDLEWNNISDSALNKNNKHFTGIDISKPSSFNKMIDVAKKLSEDIPQVRVDFYEIDDKAVFGEMTFTTGYGSYSEEFYRYLGGRIDLSKVEKLPKPNTL